MPSSNEFLLEWVQRNVQEGRYHVSAHAMSHHPVQEGFTPAHAKVAILNGTLLSHREHESRCLICGDCPAIKADERFHGTWIHCAIQYDFVSGILIITMYRPKIAEWDTPFKRRKR